MLELRKGDLFQSGCEAIVNAVNCIGISGAGLALAFRKKFPEMHDDYVKVCREHKLKPGQMHVWEGSNPKFIINFPTKNDLKPSQMSFITSGLVALKNEIEERGIKSIAIPALGCGLGGLDYKKVKVLIEEFATQVPDVQVVLYEPLE